MHSGCCRLYLPFEQMRRPLTIISGGYWTDPFAHISKLLWDFSKEILHWQACASFYKSEYVFSCIQFLFYSYASMYFVFSSEI